jgi:hypothetical protein
MPENIKELDNEKYYEYNGTVMTKDRIYLEVPTTIYVKNEVKDKGMACGEVSEKDVLTFSNLLKASSGLPMSGSEILSHVSAIFRNGYVHGEEGVTMCFPPSSIVRANIWWNRAKVVDIFDEDNNE